MIRLLIADDSALMRRLLVDLFEAEGDFEVAVARDGPEALAAVGEFRPDVITLDVHMPGLNGLECLDRIMVMRPTPVVMVSALTRDGADETIRALALGAVDVVPKPTGAVSLRMDELGPRLVQTVRAAATVRLPAARRLAERIRARSEQPPAQLRRLRRRPPPRPLPRSPAAGQPPGLVIVGTSTGGPPALDALLKDLPANFPWPIVIAQHMPASFTAALARRLDSLTALTVSEVSGPTPLQPGCAYVGRGDADLIIAGRAQGPVAMAAPESPAHRWHPSVDRLTDSAMEHLPPGRLIGVLMTGMGDDGAAAMTRLHRAGGRTIAEAEETAVVWGMPGALVHAGGADFVLPLDSVGRGLMDLVAA